MAWLAESTDRVDLAADPKRWGVWEYLWRALDPLPLKDQDRYFERPMMRFLQRAQRLDSYYNAFTYLSRRCASNVDKGQAPGDGPQIRANVDRALAVLATSLPNLHRDALGRLRTDPSLSKLLTPDKLAGPGIPGGVLLFDSSGEERSADAVAGRSLSDPTWNAWLRGSFTGITAGDILWLARLRETAIVVTRVVISKRTSQTYEIPAPATGVTARLKISMALSPTHLVLADRYRVFAIPLANQAPYLDVARCQVAGPKFGKDDTGGSTKAIGAGSVNGVHFRHITAAFPAGDSVYLGLEERTMGGDCLFGALYRWRLGAAESELLAASDSLQPGPLNDCLPYRLLGGCATPAGDACFVLDTIPKQPAEGQRRGLWKYRPGSAKWEKMSDLVMTIHEDPPRMRKAGFFDIASGNTHWQLDLAKGTVQPAKGAVGGADPERGWYHFPLSEGGVSSAAVVRMDGARQSRRFVVPNARRRVGRAPADRAGAHRPRRRPRAHQRPGDATPDGLAVAGGEVNQTRQPTPMRITWNELTVALDTHSHDDLLSEWRWQIKDGFQISLISSLGDLFLSDSAGHVHWLDSGAGRLNEVAAGLDEFQQLRQQQSYVAEWFFPRLVGAILQRGVRLAFGQCFSYKLPPILGGQMQPTNFEATDLCVHLSILGQINRRAKDFPEETPIERSSFIQPSASQCSPTAPARRWLAVFALIKSWGKSLVHRSMVSKNSGAFRFPALASKSAASASNFASLHARPTKETPMGSP